MWPCLRVQIHETEEEGDVLVFLPGQEDIEALAMLLEEAPPVRTGQAGWARHTR